MSTVGDKLGRYELITRIGQGGMAEVQLAIQRGPAGFEKLVVVKLVHENLATQKTFVDMLLDEARVAAMVKHPNVVDIYDLGEDGGRYFIAMEYLEGEPLLSVLRAGREGKRLDVLSTARLIAETAEGLEAAHGLRTMAGEHIELVHHDVSLGNIVILYDGQVKLVDFGVAKATQSAVGPGAGKVQGKFSYMAPEKLKGGAGDRRSDIWSLGCVLWEALTLRRLFKGGNDSDTMKQVLDADIPLPSSVNGDVPHELDPIVMRSLAREPEDRYATAAQMAEELEDFLRTKNYARKNHVIARYMQETFADHIVARKKLLQDVASKGAADTEVVDAAFEERNIAHGSPVETGDAFSIKFKRPSSETTEDPETPVPSRTVSEPPTPLLPPRTVSEPYIEQIVADPDPPPPTPVATRTRTRPKPVTTSPMLQVKARPTLPQAPARRGMPIALIAIGALVIAGVVVAAIMMTAKKDDAPAPPRATEPPPVAVTTPPPVDHAKALPMPSNAVPVDAASPPDARSWEQEDAAFKPALQLLVRGDAKRALAAFEKLPADYPPAQRGIGLAAEKLKNIARAREAYGKYLELSPDAEDAPAIRKRLDGLPALR